MKSVRGQAPRQGRARGAWSFRSCFRSCEFYWLYTIQIPNPDFKTGLVGADWAVWRRSPEFNIRVQGCPGATTVLYLGEPERTGRCEISKRRLHFQDASGFRIPDCNSNSVPEWRCENTKCVFRFPRWWTTFQNSSISVWCNVIWTGVKVQSDIINFEQGALQFRIRVL